MPVGAVQKPTRVPNCFFFRFFHWFSYFSYFSYLLASGRRRLQRCVRRERYLIFSLVFSFFDFLASGRRRLERCDRPERFLNLAHFSVTQLFVVVFLRIFELFQLFVIFDF